MEEAFKHIQVHEIFHLNHSSLGLQSMSACICATVSYLPSCTMYLHPSCAGLSHMFIVFLAYVFLHTPTD